MNSFHRRKSHIRPLLVKLKESTYRRYKNVWKLLICFVYRVISQRELPALPSSLTGAQSASLNRMLHAAELLLHQAQAPLAAWEGKGGRRQEASGQADDGRGVVAALEQSLDQACLRFCIALLDHCLLDKIYSSVVVGFLAVLGIYEQEKPRFHNAAAFTTELSAFVKIAQLLVVQRAVVAAETGETEFPAEALEEMQDRFMVFESRSPMAWVLKLRAYGKQIRESTTSLGQLVWSDDGEHLSYAGLELEMAQLKLFVEQQIGLCQLQLEGLLLIHADEIQEDVVPPVNLRAIKDNPSVEATGWSFLQDERNRHLHGHEDWLLDRVLDNGWLQDEFLVRPNSGKWKVRAVEHYQGQVDSFLRRLLLLIHLTGRQRTLRLTLESGDGKVRA